MSDNRGLDEIFNSRPLIERTWFRLLLMGMILGVAWGIRWALIAHREDAHPPAVTATAPAKAERPPAASNPLRQPTVEEIAEWYRTHQPLYDKIVRVAGEAAAGDPEAEHLVALLRERTHLARIQPGGVVYSVWTGVESKSQAGMERALNSTAVVLATRAESGFFPGGAPSAFFFSRGDLNFVDAWEYADWYLGVLVIHELSHWDDIVVSKREPRNARQFTDAWTDGELRAHAIENRLLDRRTLGRFSETLGRVLRDETLSGPATGGAPFRVPTEAGQIALLNAFGDAPKSKSELGLRGGTAMAAFLMLQVGESGPKARAAYNWMVQNNI